MQSKTKLAVFSLLMLSLALKAHAQPRIEALPENEGIRLDFSSNGKAVFSGIVQGPGIFNDEITSIESYIGGFSSIQQECVGRFTMTNSSLNADHVELRAVLNSYDSSISVLEASHNPLSSTLAPNVTVLLPISNIAQSSFSGSITVGKCAFFTTFLNKAVASVPHYTTAGYTGLLNVHGMDVTSSGVISIWVTSNSIGVGTVNLGSSATPIGSYAFVTKTMTGLPATRPSIAAVGDGIFMGVYFSGGSNANLIVGTYGSGSPVLSSSEHSLGTFDYVLTCKLNQLNRMAYLTGSSTAVRVNVAQYATGSPPTAQLFTFAQLHSGSSRGPSLVYLTNQVALFAFAMGNNFATLSYGCLHASSSDSSFITNTYTLTGTSFHASSWVAISERVALLLTISSSTFTNPDRTISVYYASIQPTSATVTLNSAGIALKRFSSTIFPRLDAASFLAKRVLVAYHEASSPSRLRGLYIDLLPTVLSNPDLIYPYIAKVADTTLLSGVSYTSGSSFELKYFPTSNFDSPSFIYTLTTSSATLSVSLLPVYPRAAGIVTETNTDFARVQVDGNFNSPGISASANTGTECYCLFDGTISCDYNSSPLKIGTVFSTGVGRMWS